MSIFRCLPPVRVSDLRLKTITNNQRKSNKGFKLNCMLEYGTEVPQVDILLPIKGSESRQTLFFKHLNVAFPLCVVVAMDSTATFLCGTLTCHIQSRDVHFLQRNHHSFVRGLKESMSILIFVTHCHWMRIPSSTEGRNTEDGWQRSGASGRKIVCS